MTNEELTQALQVLADEFRGTFEVVSDEDDYFAVLKLDDVHVQFCVYRVLHPFASASVSASTNGVRSESDHIVARHPETILTWLRARLLESTQVMREIEFEAVLQRLVKTCFDTSCIDTFNRVSGSTLDQSAVERGREIISSTTKRLRELAFGGK